MSARTAPIALLSLLLAACSSDIVEPPVEEVPLIGSITLAVDTLTLSVEDDATPIAIDVRDTQGGSVGADSVTWTSSNDAVARVAEDGMVTGIGAGSAVIRASYQAVTDSVLVQVTGVARGIVRGISLSPDTLRINDTTSDSLTIAVSLAKGAEVEGMIAYVARSGLLLSCVLGPTETSGVWGCTDGQFTAASCPGDYRLAALHVRGKDGNGQWVTGADLTAVGFDPGFAVSSARPPCASTNPTNSQFTPPVMPTRVSLRPQPVDATTSIPAVTIDVEVQDPGPYSTILEVLLVSPSGNLKRSCSMHIPPNGSSVREGSCNAFFAPNIEGGDWSITLDISSVARYRSEHLQAFGLVDRVEVYSPNEDVSPPVLRAFSIEPDTVYRSSDSRRVVFRAHLTDEGNGVDKFRVNTRIEAGGTRVTTTLQCSSNAPVSGDRRDGIWECGFDTFSNTATGEHLIWYVSATDGATPGLTMEGAELAAAGFDSTIVIVP